MLDPGGFQSRLERVPLLYALPTVRFIAMRPRSSVILAVVVSLLFVRITGAHYLVCLDQQEPSTTIIQEIYVVGAMFGGDACPDTDSLADINLDLSKDSSAAKSIQADIELLALMCVFLALFLFPSTRQPPVTYRITRRYLVPPRFMRPPLRAPPL